MMRWSVKKKKKRNVAPPNRTPSDNPPALRLMTTIKRFAQMLTSLYLLCNVSDGVLSSVWEVDSDEVR